MKINIKNIHTVGTFYPTKRSMNGARYFLEIVGEYWRELSGPVLNQTAQAFNPLFLKLIGMRLANNPVRE